MNQTRWQKLTLLLISTLTVMSGATLSPSLPAMREAFSDVANADVWVRLVLTLPTLFIVLSAPLAGVVTDKLGRKPLLIASTILYGFAGASGFVLESLWAILTGRALLGLAVGGIMISVTTLLTDYFDGKERANVLGLQGTFMNVGGILFLSLGGVLADVDWQLPFLIYLFAWLPLPAALYSLREPRRPDDQGEAVRPARLGSPQHHLQLGARAYGDLLHHPGTTALLPHRQFRSERHPYGRRCCDGDSFRRALVGPLQPRERQAQLRRDRGRFVRFNERRLRPYRSG